MIDELGFSNLKANSFEPTYNYYQKDGKIIIRVEAPGNCDIEANSEPVGEYTMIKINGTKGKEPEKFEDSFIIIREFGDFSLDIPLKSEFVIKNEKPSIIKKNGLIIITYQFDKKNKTGKYTQDQNDEI